MKLFADFLEWERKYNSKFLDWISATLVFLLLIFYFPFYLIFQIIKRIAVG